MLLTAAFLVVSAVLFFVDFPVRRSASETDQDYVLETEGKESGSPSLQESGAQAQEDAPASAESAGTAPGSEQASVYVYVCGQVVHPDVYQMAAGSRVFEAVRAAGSFTEKADRNALNLADTVKDGQKIYVPAIGESSSAAAGSDAGTGTAQARLNINTASVEQLDTLPGIGRTRAQAIVAYREKNGPFEDIRGLLKVSGIKEGTFSKFEDLICVQ